MIDNVQQLVPHSYKTVKLPLGRKHGVTIIVKQFAN